MHLLVSTLFEHCSRATAIELAFGNQCAKQNVSYSRANLNPAFGGLTAQLRFPILPESRLGFRSKGGELGLRPFSPNQNGETCAVVQPNSTSFAVCETVNPAATSCHSRHVTRNLFVSFVFFVVETCDSYRPVHTDHSPNRRDFNSRSVVSSSANDCRNRAATKDYPFQNRPNSPLRFTAWLSAGLNSIVSRPKRHGKVQHGALILQQAPRNCNVYG